MLFNFYLLNTAMSFYNWILGAIHCQLASIRPSFDVNSNTDLGSFPVVTANNWYPGVYLF
jgi:hypothetical protein